MRSVPLMLLVVLLTAPTPAALAQEQQDHAPAATLPSLPRTPAPAGPQRQGPELDVFRDPAPGQAPAQQAPVIQIPPPVVAPPVTTTPTTRAEPSRPSSPRETPAAERRAPAPTAPEPAPSDVAPDTTPRNDAAVQPDPAADAAPQPGPEPEPASEPAPTPAASTPTEGDGAPWQWIVGGLLLLLVLAAAAFRRGRSRADLALPPPAEPDLAVAPPPAAEPESLPAPAPRPAPPPVHAPDRPHLALALEVEGARFSMMGATVTYRLALTNGGAVEARDILVRGVIANANAPMDDLLKPFFAGEAGLAIHSVPALAPGETIHLKSELRLDSDRIAPISAGSRALLIPLLAFDARYGWDAQGDGAQGRTGRAFIVGQEQEPPTERLSPFRLDLGPRQFRRPAARATALLLDA